MRTLAGIQMAPRTAIAQASRGLFARGAVAEIVEALARRSRALLSLLSGLSNVRGTHRALADRTQTDTVDGFGLGQRRIGITVGQRQFDRGQLAGRAERIL